jgi:hypothetical protein
MLCSTHIVRYKVGYKVGALVDFLLTSDGEGQKEMAQNIKVKRTFNTEQLHVSVESYI